MREVKSTSKKPLLDELVFGALSQLQILDYNERSIRRYQATWSRLIKFAKQHHFEDKLTQKLIIEFLDHYGIKSTEYTSTKSGWRKHAEYSLKILWQFARYGYFERIHTLIQKLKIPQDMKKVLSEYAKYCEEKRHIGKYCISERIRQIGLLLNFVVEQGVQAFEQIKPQQLSLFICSLWRFSNKTVSRVVSDMRQFLKYLFLRDLIAHDMSQALPTVHVPSHAKIPSVWDKELVVKLLAAVDRSSPKGKRDYAILLLACRLGLRTGDIRDLTLDQIDWEAETLTLTQSKTQQPLILPLTAEVGNALIDYLRFGRPKTHYRQVFLRLYPVQVPFSKGSHLYQTVDYWRKVAGIQFRRKQHQGLHSLRHSLATYLLEEGTPFPVISNILGHSSTASTMIYAKSSIEMLREVALSLEGINHAKHY
ncbi:tyrosine-type recombinase/integrase [Legionella sp. MW5194]|uniref:site-specific integrase n=1 Tax=Legionella sp. MW5194 TaxID=2662448 RepID=UPI00193DB4A0|nr:site-specific integrase [Legionella sp. MW5194]QRN03484.1 tyrosine-type recombinase/integrase [Legionella sp. MW5194]